MLSMQSSNPLTNKSAEKIRSRHVAVSIVAGARNDAIVLAEYAAANAVASNCVDAARAAFDMTVASMGGNPAAPATAPQPVAAAPQEESLGMKLLKKGGAMAGAKLKEKLAKPAGPAKDEMNVSYDAMDFTFTP